jgi:hypothetical protein
MKIIVGVLIVSIFALVGCGGGGGLQLASSFGDSLGYIGSQGGIVDNPPERDITTGYVEMAPYGLPASDEATALYSSIINFDLSGVNRRISENYMASQQDEKLGGYVRAYVNNDFTSADCTFNFSNCVGIDTKKDKTGAKHVYVMDEDSIGRIRITKLNASLTNIEEQVSLEHGKFPLNHPVNIGADAQGRVYIADSDKVIRIEIKNDATHIAPDGIASLAPFATPLALTSATDVDVDGGGRIYVASPGAHQVKVFDKNGSPIAAKFPFTFINPTRLAVTSSGDLNVLDETPPTQFHSLQFVMGFYSMQRS